MLVLILIDVQYSQKAVFSFEEGSKYQNNSSSGSLHPVNPPPPFSKIYHPLPLLEGAGEFTPPPLTAIRKTLKYSLDSS